MGETIDDNWGTENGEWRIRNGGTWPPPRVGRLFERWLDEGVLLVDALVGRRDRSRDAVGAGNEWLEWLAKD